MIKPSCVLLSALIFLPASAPAQNTAYSQILSLQGAAPGVCTAPLAPQPVPEGGVTRWPTASHTYFNTALILNIKNDDPDGEFYPFAGGTPGKTDENGNPVDRGLVSGMGSEEAHPSLFANGGDPRRVWDQALKSYNRLDFADAYEKIGLVCHLTQDQAVPAHAANINHVITFGDKFEGAIKKNLSLFERIRGRAQAMLLPDLQPFEYYQLLQDDTREHLAEWRDPGTGIPYWPPAADAPPLGQDATKGPWSHYPSVGDKYSLGVSPGIMDRQMLMTAVYTYGVLKSAARLLPPVVGHLQAGKLKDDRRSEVDLSFDVYDNRKGEVELAIERPLYGYSGKADLRVVSGGQTVPSGSYSLRLPAPAAYIKGKDLVIITAKDADGNVSSARTEVHYTEPFDAGLTGG